MVFVVMLLAIDNDVVIIIVAFVVVVVVVVVVAHVQLDSTPIPTFSIMSQMPYNEVIGGLLVVVKE